MNVRRQLAKLLILSSFLGGILYLSFKLPADEEQDIRENHYKVVGEVFLVDRYVHIGYKIGNKTYLYRRNKPYLGIAAGEAFYTLASKKDKNRALVYFSRPIMDTTQYSYALVRPLDVSKSFLNWNEINFTYKVGAEEFERTQRYEAGERPDKTDSLMVKYRVGRPDIGYLVK